MSNLLAERHPPTRPRLRRRVSIGSRLLIIAAAPCFLALISSRHHPICVIHNFSNFFLPYLNELPKTHLFHRPREFVWTLGFPPSGPVLPAGPPRHRALALLSLVSPLPPPSNHHRPHLAMSTPSSFQPGPPARRNTTTLESAPPSEYESPQAQGVTAGSTSTADAQPPHQGARRRGTAGSSLGPGQQGGVKRKLTELFVPEHSE